jgi:hypothetical protein
VQHPFQLSFNDLAYHADRASQTPSAHPHLPETNYYTPETMQQPQSTSDTGPHRGPGCKQINFIIYLRLPHSSMKITTSSSFTIALYCDKFVGNYIKLFSVHIANYHKIELDINEFCFMLSA